MKIMITGGAGFIGHHVIEHLLINTDHELVVLDKLTYAGNLDRLREIGAHNNYRVSIYTADFNQPIEPGLAKEIGAVDVIIHMGAETHVDNSIDNPEIFVRSNIIGTMHMMDYARTLPDLKLFYYFSTDEVFGPATDGVEFDEEDPHNPSNPYSAAKSGGEMLVKAYMNTYKLPAIITRTMNVFGERQHCEKFIPKVINAVLKGEIIPIHANADKTKAGTRFYIHARNVADSVLFLLNNHTIGESYHIVGEKEVSNLDLAKFIAEVIGKPLNYEMVDFHSSRPGHDLRYALSGEKMRRQGWTPPKSFETSLTKTIEWTLEHSQWL